jgi:hypothetical protein
MKANVNIAMISHMVTVHIVRRVPPCECKKKKIQGQEVYTKKERKKKKLKLKK